MGAIDRRHRPPEADEKATGLRGLHERVVSRMKGR